jgi:hypothetical protein
LNRELNHHRFGRRRRVGFVQKASSSQPPPSGDYFLVNPDGKPLVNPDVKPLIAANP